MRDHGKAVDPTRQCEAPVRGQRNRRCLNRPLLGSPFCFHHGYEASEPKGAPEPGYEWYPLRDGFGRPYFWLQLRTDKAKRQARYLNRHGATLSMSERTEIRRVLGEESDHEIKQKRGGSMKANTATLADVKLVLSAPKHIQTKRCGYSKALVTFGLAQTKFMDHATSTTWTSTVEAARQLHAEAKRAEREREAAASRAARDEGGEARWP